VALYVDDIAKRESEWGNRGFEQFAILLIDLHWCGLSLMFGNHYSMMLD
jgi:hypothetical protein